MDEKVFWFNDKETIDEDDSIYSEYIRDELLDDDELSSGELGFMNGYDEAYL